MARRVVAVLGLGSIGLRHATNLIELGAEVIGFDPDTQRQAMLEEKGGRTVDSVEAALRGGEAVVVATPNAHHIDHCAAALDQECHIFVEKPLAHTIEGLDALVEAAASTGRVFFVGQNLRYHPGVRKAKSLIESNAIGEILWSRLMCGSYLPDWRPDSDYRKGYAADPKSGGVLFDSIHELDLANYLFGAGETVACEARTSGQLEIESDDCADIMLRHPDGLVSVTHVDYITRPKYRVTEICGSSGFLRLEISNRRLQHTSTDGTLLNQWVWESSAAEDYKVEMASFLACVEGQEKPACDGVEAARILHETVRARRMAGLPG